MKEILQSLPLAFLKQKLSLVVKLANYTASREDKAETNFYFLSALSNRLASIISPGSGTRTGVQRLQGNPKTMMILANS